jgi:stage V sporulation protein T
VKPLEIKAVGFVRRVDDLGRVVIPKEVRKRIGIREGDPLEVLITEDGQILLRKYVPSIEK